MKAHDYYLERRLDDLEEDVGKYNYLVGKTIKAVALEESYKSELFQVVGFTTRGYSEEVLTVLKSNETDICITVKASEIGRKANTYHSKRSYVLEVL